MKLFIMSALVAAGMLFGICSVEAKTYYISSSGGNDNWNGLAENHAGFNGPWKSLTHKDITFGPGDRILLKCGDTWDDMLRLKGSGTAKNPILIGSYGKGPKPIIDRQDYNKDLMGIHLYNQGGIKIVGIEFNRCQTGIFAEYAKTCPTQNFVWIEDCYFHDSLLYGNYKTYPKPRNIGLGICFFSHDRANRFVLTDMMIKNCVFRRLASAVWTNSHDNFNPNASYIYNFKNLVMEGCQFLEGYQWQQGIRGVDTGAMRDCITHNVGEGFRAWNGVAGSMFFRCKDWVFEDSEWSHVSIGLGSGDGEAFDFEGNCDNMTMRNCIFHDTDGPGFLMCCYASDGHPNKGIVMENCIVNGKSKRPIGLPRCAIVNTTDWTESVWKNCRFYLSPGETLMKVMDPENDKKTSFVDCVIKNLNQAASSENLARKAKAKGSTEASGNAATLAIDGNTETAWKPTGDGEHWLQIAFPKPIVINELKLQEDKSSSITDYVIQYYRAKDKTWVTCFSGMKIGPQFLAAVIARKTQAMRLVVKSTKEGLPGITEFSAYNDTSGEVFNDPNGVAARHKVGR